jgi:sialic acid synthase SpsE
MRIVAEIGLHHGGDFRRCEDIIASASACGSTDVKLQYFTREDLLGRAKGAGWDVLSRYALKPWQVSNLRATAGHCGLELGVSFFGVNGARSFREACGDVDWCKIPAPQSQDRQLVEEVRALGRPMVLSFYPDQDICNTCNDDVALHCTRGYPTPDAALALGRISTLPKIFKGIGWSCHADARHPTSAELACLAYAAGARWFEFHFRDDLVHTDSPDYDVSLWPDLMAYTVQQLKRCAEIVGS